MPARTRVQPGDVHPAAAARRMGMTLIEFDAVLPRLLSRGFPAADRDTGMYDLDAIDAWRRKRNPQLFGLTGDAGLRNAKDVARERIDRM